MGYAISLKRDQEFEDILLFHPIDSLRLDTLEHLAHKMGERGSCAMIECFMLEFFDRHANLASHMLYGAAPMEREKIVDSLAHYCDVPAVLERLRKNPSAKNIQGEQILEHWLTKEQRLRIVQQLDATERVKMKKI